MANIARADDARREIVGGKGTIGYTGLQIVQKLEFDEWEELGDMLKYWGSSINYLLGDWLNYGEREYGEKYAQALEDTEYELQTLRNYAYVCRQIPLERRRPELTFSHHAAVAGLDDQEQDILLGRAIDEKMGVRELRKSVSDLRIKQGKKALPEVCYSEFADIWDRHGLPKPAVENDPCLVPVARKISRLEQELEGLKKQQGQALPDGVIPVREDVVKKLIYNCSERPFGGCDNCECAEECATLQEGSENGSGNEALRDNQSE